VGVRRRNGAGHFAPTAIGEQLRRRIPENAGRKNLPDLLISSNVASNDLELAREIGVARVMNKPVMPWSCWKRLPWRCVGRPADRTNSGGMRPNATEPTPEDPAG